VLDEILGRLRYLKDVGLGYLTLDRQSRTLSGGEVQRVALASALGASLVNSLYVLDEPSIGLHPRDNERLIRILQRLRDSAQHHRGGRARSGHHPRRRLPARPGAAGAGEAAAASCISVRAGRPADR
jgi:ABC-type transport system involved in cytochrome c biogenesis ATPase subunit